MFTRARCAAPLIVATMAVLPSSGCGGDGEDASGASSTAATAVAPVTSPVTEGTGVTLPVETVAPPSTSTTTTLPPEGLPESHPVPANGILTLGGDSTWAQSVDVRGVPIGEVHDWFVGGLTDGGYTITNDRPAHVEFSGDGIFGTADLTVGDAEVVEITFVLGAPLG